jgi:hypothetical protein
VLVTLARMRQPSSRQQGQHPTNAVYYLFTKHLRDSGVPGEALKRKLKKDISFALRRGTIAQVTTLLLPALDRQATSDEPAQRAAEAELHHAVNYHRYHR